MFNQKKQDNDKGGINPVAAVITGAVIGAGVMVAGAVALKDGKNRKKVKEALNNAKNQTDNYINGLQKKANDKKDNIDKKVAVDKENVKKVMKSTKSSKITARKMKEKAVTPSNK